MRLSERGLTSGMLLDSVASLEIVERYPDDKYLPSFLLRGEARAVIYHVQIAVDQDNHNVRIVTMYLPHPEEWDAEKRVRLNPDEV